MDSGAPARAVGRTGADLRFGGRNHHHGHGFRTRSRVCAWRRVWGKPACLSRRLCSCVAHRGGI